MKFTDDERANLLATGKTDGEIDLAANPLPAEEAARRYDKVVYNCPFWPHLAA